MLDYSKFTGTKPTSRKRTDSANYRGNGLVAFFALRSISVRGTKRYTYEGCGAMQTRNIVDWIEYMWRGNGWKHRMRIKK
jgi:hypothetical protein